MGLYCGIDLHSNNAYYGIVDAEGKRIFKRRLPNELPRVLETLAPFKEELERLAAESTYNWYWLVDGLQANDYPVQLANPAAMEQYSGLKHADDQHDAFFLAEMLRLGILPTGYIYPKEERPVRDLLRRRMLLVQLKTVQLLSLQSLLSRETGQQITGNQLKQLKDEALQVLLPEEHLFLAGQTNLSVIEFLERKIGELEQAILKRAKLKPEYETLLTVPGIGKILSLTIMYETGDIGRFPEVGNYTSYCRCASARRFSNQKEKGRNNGKNGNRYLSWAYIEAASFAIRCCPPAQKFYQRKKAKTKACVAMKALASKWSKACYFILRDQAEFQIERVFG
ncbi:MAG: IS110 family transposase [Armatimonadetes bacterium CG2_30_59_28]|nr:IS110 family transposase [Armatimonadota bacterium]OIO93511.1 MAG: IS110 family transposase [Armatimonadetes bacterium CG2_30_59_28]PIU60336.1 MAG: IS110 family transposase [Armatimonadetes bacterium CG07_land_8_20_14_0_80_59_28]PIX38363.1 MAG: IS110 family transposase [Armatimonadetes bacterium CG_4_8_14_3_um_filter_58_9]PIY43721.1 MAG: IS110 family transposase [Armatimonadetes bacterium CG_4_10_14_3_um_filter_59_10]